MRQFGDAELFVEPFRRPCKYNKVTKLRRVPANNFCVLLGICLIP